MFMELYREEKREDRDRCPGGKRGKSKGEIDLGRILFNKCSQQPGTHTEIYRVGLRRETGERR